LLLCALDRFLVEAVDEMEMRIEMREESYEEGGRLQIRSDLINLHTISKWAAWPAGHLHTIRISSDCQLRRKSHMYSK
jgi:hypothetical protein